jgi:deazaflavin-dependent oxidoreductase (nitroreductase family)
VRPSDKARLRRGVVQWRSYVALAAMARVFTEPVEAGRRYLDAGYGRYPWHTRLRTPLGPVDVTIPDGHDVRTVNEVFCRHDYGTTAHRVVVDVGANIGVAALYFLTRRSDSVVYAFEPVAANVDTLERNLAPFRDRVHLDPRALSPGGGPARFFVERVGRYSGLAEYYRHELEHDEVVVDTVAVADALDSVLATEGRIDLLKVDTEGSEEALVTSVRPDQWERIGAVRWEREDHVETGPPPGAAPGWAPRTAPMRSRDMPAWLKATFTAPNRLYDIGLGRLLGGRFLRLTHTGRRSGRGLHTVLEVVDHDESTGAVTVVSGFGPRADWFRNVEAGGPVAVDLGRGPRAARHEVLSSEEAERILARYERRNRIATPVLRRALSAMVGWRYRGTPDQRRRLVSELPVVRFTPAPAAPAGAQSSGPPAT